jgi:hypothetical protein
MRYNSEFVALVRMSRLIMIPGSTFAVAETQGTLASSAEYITTLSCALGSFRQPMQQTAVSLPRFTATCGTFAGMNR